MYLNSTVRNMREEFQTRISTLEATIKSLQTAMADVIAQKPQREFTLYYEDRVYKVMGETVQAVTAKTAGFSGGDSEGFSVLATDSTGKQRTVWHSKKTPERWESRWLNPQMPSSATFAFTAFSNEELVKTTEVPAK